MKSLKATAQGFSAHQNREATAAEATGTDGEMDRPTAGDARKMQAKAGWPKLFACRRDA